MTIDMVKDLSADVFKVILLVSAPTLLVSLLVGLAVSFFQAVTQIQEFTLTFVPKILAVFLCLYLLFPWLSRVLVGFTTDIFGKIPMYVR
jgi:flagellar biosynthetic protein FliQ